MLPVSPMAPGRAGGVAGARRVDRELTGNRPYLPKIEFEKPVFHEVDAGLRPSGQKIERRFPDCPNVPES